MDNNPVPQDSDLTERRGRRRLSSILKVSARSPLKDLGIGNELHQEAAIHKRRKSSRRVSFAENIRIFAPEIKSTESVGNGGIGTAGPSTDENGKYHIAGMDTLLHGPIQVSAHQAEWNNGNKDRTIFFADNDLDMTTCNTIVIDGLTEEKPKKMGAGLFLPSLGPEKNEEPSCSNFTFPEEKLKKMDTDSFFASLTRKSEAHWNFTNRNKDHTILFSSVNDMDMTTSNTIVIDGPNEEQSMTMGASLNTENDGEPSTSNFQFTDEKPKKVDTRSFLASLKAQKEPSTWDFKFKDPPPSTNLSAQTKIKFADFLASLESAKSGVDKENIFPFASGAKADTGNLTQVSREPEDRLELTRCATTDTTSFHPVASQSALGNKQEINVATHKPVSADQTLLHADDMDMTCSHTIQIQGQDGMIHGRKSLGFNSRALQDKTVVFSDQNDMELTRSHEVVLDNAMHNRKSNAISFQALEEKTVVFSDPEEMELTRSHTMTLDGKMHSRKSFGSNSRALQEKIVNMDITTSNTIVIDGLEKEKARKMEAGKYEEPSTSNVAFAEEKLKMDTDSFFASLTRKSDTYWNFTNHNKDGTVLFSCVNDMDMTTSNTIVIDGLPEKKSKKMGASFDTENTGEQSTFKLAEEKAKKVDTSSFLVNLKAQNSEEPSTWDFKFKDLPPSTNLSAQTKIKFADFLASLESAKSGVDKENMFPFVSAAKRNTGNLTQVSREQEDRLELTRCATTDTTSFHSAASRSKSGLGNKQEINVVTHKTFSADQTLLHADDMDMTCSHTIQIQGQDGMIQGRKSLGLSFRDLQDKTVYSDQDDMELTRSHTVALDSKMPNRKSTGPNFRTLQEKMVVFSDQDDMELTRSHTVALDSKMPSRKSISLSSMTLQEKAVVFSDQDDMELTRSHTVAFDGEMHSRKSIGQVSRALQDKMFSSDQDDMELTRSHTVAFDGDLHSRKSIGTGSRPMQDKMVADPNDMALTRSHTVALDSKMPSRKSIDLNSKALQEKTVVFSDQDDMELTRSHTVALDGDMHSRKSIDLGSMNLQEKTVVFSDQDDMELTRSHTVALDSKMPSRKSIGLNSRALQEKTVVFSDQDDMELTRSHTVAFDGDLHSRKSVGLNSRALQDKMVADQDMELTRSHTMALDSKMPSRKSIGLNSRALQEKTVVFPDQDDMELTRSHTVALVGDTHSRKSTGQVSRALQEKNVVFSDQDDMELTRSHTVALDSKMPSRKSIGLISKALQEKTVVFSDQDDMELTQSHTVAFDGDLQSRKSVDLNSRALQDKMVADQDNMELTRSHTVTLDSNMSNRKSTGLNSRTLQEKNVVFSDQDDMELTRSHTVAFNGDVHSRKSIGQVSRALQEKTVVFSDQDDMELTRSHTVAFDGDTHSRKSIGQVSRALQEKTVVFSDQDDMELTRSHTVALDSNMPNIKLVDLRSQSPTTCLNEKSLVQGKCISIGRRKSILKVPNRTGNLVNDLEMTLVEHSGIPHTSAVNKSALSIPETTFVNKTIIFQDDLEYTQCHTTRIEQRKTDLQMSSILSKTVAFSTDDMDFTKSNTIIIDNPVASENAKSFLSDQNLSHWADLPHKKTLGVMETTTEKHNSKKENTLQLSEPKDMDVTHTVATENKDRSRMKIPGSTGSESKLTFASTAAKNVFHCEEQSNLIREEEWGIRSLSVQHSLDLAVGEETDMDITKLNAMFLDDLPVRTSAPNNLQNPTCISEDKTSSRVHAPDSPHVEMKLQEDNKNVMFSSDNMALTKSRTVANKTSLGSVAKSHIDLSVEDPVQNDCAGALKNNATHSMTEPGPRSGQFGKDIHVSNLSSKRKSIAFLQKAMGTGNENKDNVETHQTFIREDLFERATMKNPTAHTVVDLKEGKPSEENTNVNGGATQLNIDSSSMMTGLTQEHNVLRKSVDVKNPTEKSNDWFKSCCNLGNLGPSQMDALSAQAKSKEVGIENTREPLESEMDQVFKDKDNIVTNEIMKSNLSTLATDLLLSVPKTELNSQSLVLTQLVSKEKVDADSFTACDLKSRSALSVTSNLLCPLDQTDNCILREQEKDDDHLSEACWVQKDSEDYQVSKKPRLSKRVSFRLPEKQSIGESFVKLNQERMLSDQFGLTDQSNTERVIAAISEDESVSKDAAQENGTLEKDSVRRRSVADLLMKIKGSTWKSENLTTPVSCLDSLPECSDPLSGGSLPKQTCEQMGNEENNLDKECASNETKDVVLTKETCLQNRLSVNVLQPKLPRRSSKRNTQEPTPSRPSRTSTILQALTDGNNGTCIDEEMLPPCFDQEENSLLQYEVPEGAWEELCKEENLLTNQESSIAKPKETLNGQKRGRDSEDGEEDIRTEKRARRNDDTQNTQTQVFQNPADSSKSEYSSHHASKSMEQTYCSSSSQDSKGDGMSVELNSQHYSQIDSQMSCDPGGGLNLWQKFHDGTITVREFFKLLRIRILIQEPRYSVLPTNHDEETSTPTDLLRDHYIYQPKLQIYEEECQTLYQQIEELKQYTEMQHKPLIEVNSILWEAMSMCSENELMSFGVTMNNMKSIYSKKSKLLAHEGKMSVYSKLLQSAQVHVEQLRSRISEADCLLEEMDECIAMLDTETTKLRDNPPSVEECPEMVSLKSQEESCNREKLLLEEQKEHILTRLGCLQEEARKLDQQLQEPRYTEWDVVEWTEDKASFLFLYESLVLDIKFGQEIDGERFNNQPCRRISSVTCSSDLDDDTAPPSSLLVHRLLQRYIESMGCLHERYQTQKALPQLLFDLSLGVSRCKLLGEEVEHLSKWGAKYNITKTQVENNEVKLLFSSSAVTAKFQLIVQVTEKYPTLPLSFSVLKRFGSIDHSAVAVVLAEVPVGLWLLKRAAKSIYEKLLKRQV